MSSATTDPLRLQPGAILAGKYLVEEQVGSGWEGQVYRVVEKRTGAMRAAKLFYPERNRGGRTVARYARKLEALRDCPLTLHYHHSETLEIHSREVTCLISEFVDGEILGRLRRRSPGQRLAPFEGLTSFTPSPRASRASTLPSSTTAICTRTTSSSVGSASASTSRSSTFTTVGAVEALGGSRRYARLPDELRWICAGLKHGLIRARFPTATRLREHLERMTWSS